MKDNNVKIRLAMKMTFKLQKDTRFICKIPFLKKIAIQLCQNVQKVDY